MNIPASSSLQGVLKEQRMYNKLILKCTQESKNNNVKFFNTVISIIVCVAVINKKMYAF